MSGREPDLVVGAATVAPVPGPTTLLPPKLSRRGRKPIMPHVLTLREAAAILRTSVRAVRGYLVSGRLHGYRTGSDGYGEWRTTDLAVLAYMGFPVPGFKPVMIKRGLGPGRPTGGASNSPIARAKTPEERKAVTTELNRRLAAKRAARRTLHIGQPGGCTAGPPGGPAPGPDEADG